MRKKACTGLGFSDVLMLFLCSPFVERVLRVAWMLEKSYQNRGGVDPVLLYGTAEPCWTRFSSVLNCWYKPEDTPADYHLFMAV
ncbi:hypothetical protein Tco_0480281 [Tanacetum coccineum]